MKWDEILHNFSAYGGIFASLFAVLFAFSVGAVSLGFELLFGLLLTFAVVFGVRIFYFKERPDKTRYCNFFQRIDASSFPSMHSMRAFMLSTVLAINFPSAGVVVLVSVFAIATAVLRVLQKRHHVSDTIVGSIFGIGVGVLSWYFGANL